jgi:hypothetical protein
LDVANADIGHHMIDPAGNNTIIKEVNGDLENTKRFQTQRDIHSGPDRMMSKKKPSGSEISSYSGG